MVSAALVVFVDHDPVHHAPDQPPSVSAALSACPAALFHWPFTSFSYLHRTYQCYAEASPCCALPSRLLSRRRSSVALHCISVSRPGVSSLLLAFPLLFHPHDAVSLLALPSRIFACLSLSVSKPRWATLYLSVTDQLHALASLIYSVPAHISAYPFQCISVRRRAVSWLVYAIPLPIVALLSFTPPGSALQTVPLQSFSALFLTLPHRSSAHHSYPVALWLCALPALSRSWPSLAIAGKGRITPPAPPAPHR